MGKEYSASLQLIEKIAPALLDDAAGSHIRVEELISDRLACGNPRPSSIDDLAEAAGVSVCHFIRTFRRTTGATGTRQSAKD